MDELVEDDLAFGILTGRGEGLPVEVVTPDVVAEGERELAAGDGGGPDLGDGGLPIEVVLPPDENAACSEKEQQHGQNEGMSARVGHGEDLFLVLRSLFLLFIYGGRVGVWQLVFAGFAGGLVGGWGT